jgi:hypothetical protein
LRFNNNTEALIFGSFHQGKEQKSQFIYKSSLPIPNQLLALELLGFVCELKR